MWRKKHWATISQNYSRAAHFRTYKEIFENLYLQETDEWLSHINYKFIRSINAIFGITTEIKWAEGYPITSSDKTEKLIEICIAEKADTYVSGPAAKNYINEALFENAKIGLSWMDYSNYPAYKQLQPGFATDVSIVDLIFNEGPQASKFMKSF